MSFAFAFLLLVMQQRNIVSVKLKCIFCFFFVKAFITCKVNAQAKKSLDF